MYQDMMDTIGFVGKYDPEVSAAMEKELSKTSLADVVASAQEKIKK